MSARKAIGAICDELHAALTALGAYWFLGLLGFTFGADDAELRGEHLGRVQPAPTPTDEPSAHDLVIAELEKRKAFGIAKYGVTLQAGNGRDHLQDALDEVLDLAVYLMCAIEQTKENR